MASLICRAVAKGDGYVVEGQKTWTSAAHIADWCWLAARTDPQAPKHRGISLLMVDMKSPGITVRPLLNVAKEHHFNEVYFDGVMVPRKNLVGEENRGWYHIVVALNFERGWPGVRIGATAKRILDRLTDFIKEAKLNLKPALRHQLAEMAVQAEAARLLGYRVVHLISKGTVPTYESSLIKVYGTELIQKIASLAMKMVGLYGQLEPHSPLAPLGGWIERLYLLCLGDTIAAGTSEIQRNIIAQWGLGLPR
jgi:alkylation response protein AidB-like acyl-CoA dehydrogenase